MSLSRVIELGASFVCNVLNTKWPVNDAWTASEAEGLGLEARIQAALLRSPNQAEAVRAGLEKRPKLPDTVNSGQLRGASSAQEGTAQAGKIRREKEKGKEEREREGRKRMGGGR